MIAIELSINVHAERSGKVMTQRKLPVRIPTAKPTEWHKDKSKYERRRKHKHDSDTSNEEVGRHTTEET